MSIASLKRNILVHRILLTLGVLLCIAALSEGMIFAGAGDVCRWIWATAACLASAWFVVRMYDHVCVFRDLLEVSLWRSSQRAFWYDYAE